MSNAYFGFIAGMIIGLVASAVINALILPPNVAYEQITIDGRQLDCVSWHDELVCESSSAVSSTAP